MSTFTDVRDGGAGTSEPQLDHDAYEAFGKVCESWRGRLFSRDLLREIRVGLCDTLAPYLHAIGEELNYDGVAVIERPERSVNVVAFVNDLTTAQQLRRIGFKMAGFRTDLYGRAHACPDHEAQRWSLRNKDEPYKEQLT